MSTLNSENAATLCNVFLYYNLKDDDSSSTRDVRESWYKEDGSGDYKSTIQYIMDNEAVILASIKKFGSKSRYSILNRQDIDNIYQELAILLCRSEDYNLGLSYREDRRDKFNREDKFLKLEDFVAKKVRDCTKQYIHKKIKDSKNIAYSSLRRKDSWRESGDCDIDIIDSLKSDSAEFELDSVEYDLDSGCKSYESYRTSFGVDIFTVAFIGCCMHGKDIEKIDKIYISCGLDVKKVHNLREHKKAVEIIQYFLSCLCSYRDKTEYIEKFKKYVYGSDDILKAISKL